MIFKLRVQQWKVTCPCNKLSQNVLETSYFCIEIVEFVTKSTKYLRNWGWRTFQSPKNGQLQPKGKTSSKADFSKSLSNNT